jgi:hypothetical protein
MMSQIEIYIEELVLEGFAAGDRHAIGDALTIELEKFLRGSDLGRLRLPPPGEGNGGGLDFDRLDAGNIALKPNAGPAVVGGQVARAVYGSLNPIRQSSRPRNDSSRSTSRKSG